MWICCNNLNTSIRAKNKSPKQNTKRTVFTVYSWNEGGDRKEDDGEMRRGLDGSLGEGYNFLSKFIERVQ
jgi:hypothetical protein